MSDDRGYALHSAAQRDALADTLGERPETTIAVHLLRRGLCHAFVASTPSQCAAAVVQGIEFLPNEPMGFGEDAAALGDLLSLVRGWTCINVARELASALGQHIQTGLGRTVHYVDEIQYLLTRPVTLVRHPAVRLLSVADLPALLAAPEQVRGSGFGSTRALLTEGVVAAGLVEDRVVAIAHTSARTRQYADIGVATLPAYQGQGMATAAAALVAQQLQRAGEQPVWSTGVTNLASQRVAEKLEFVEMARRTYVVLS